MKHVADILGLRTSGRTSMPRILNTLKQPSSLRKHRLGMGMLDDGRIWILSAMHECAVLMMLTHNVEGLKKHHHLQPFLKLDCFTLNLSCFSVPLQYQCRVRAHSFFLSLILLLQCCDVAVLQFCAELFVILGQVSVALSSSVSYCKRPTQS